MQKNHFISQSEADTWLGCKRKHYYAYGEPNSEGTFGIEPKTRSVGITRGNIGHDVLDTFYSALKDGSSLENATVDATSVLISYAADHTQEVLDLRPILLAYFDNYADMDSAEWEPLAIEHEFRLEILSGVIFPFKPDAIMRNRKTGKVFVWDHKFVFNYYADSAYDMMPQMKKYVWALRKLGYTIDGIMYNMISTRKNSKEPFRRKELVLKDNVLDTWMSEQIQVMGQIVEAKSKPNDKWRDSSLRTASAFNCSHCPFLQLCSADLSKEPGRKLLVSGFYNANTYGYGKGEENV